MRRMLGPSWQDLIHNPAVAAGRTRTLNTALTGFSLVDLLVSVSVIAVLIAVLAPSLAGVRERARQVQCGSNLRQVGLALQMYSDNNRGKLPPSTFSRPVDLYGNTEQRDPLPTEMMVVHLGEDDPNAWDGLGILFADAYLNSPLSFYCPSHTGFHPVDRYEDQWVNLGAEIVGNYNYRTENMRPASGLIGGKTAGGALSSPAAVSLVSDGLRTLPDYSHRTGNNILRLDLSVAWYNDASGFIASILPGNDAGQFRRPGLFAAWRTFDSGLPPTSDQTDEFEAGGNALMLAPAGATPGNLRGR